MNASKIILAAFIAYCVLFLPQAIFGQTETLDIIQYTPPKGWTKTAKEGIVVYTDTNQTTNAFCLLTINPTISSASTPQQDFVNAWSSFVVKPFKAPANPPTNTGTDRDGWQVTSGAAKIEMNGGNSYAVLSVISGFGKTTSVLAIYNDQSYAMQLDAFMQSITLDKTKASASASPPSQIPDPFPDRPGYVPQKPLSGTLKASITMADLVGTWDHASGSVQTYIDSNTGDYSHTNTTFYGESYSIKSDGTFQYKFAGRSMNNTVRESDSGTVMLSGSFITFKFNGRITDKFQKYQFIAFMTQPNSVAILSLVGPLHDKFPGHAPEEMSMRCGHSEGYISCVGGQAWVKLSAKPPSPTASPTAPISPTPTREPSPKTQTTPTISTTPAPLPPAITETKNSIQLAFNTLNDFPDKGLPASAALPTDNLDQAAVRMAQQISKADEQSLPVLLAALQTAGFSIIDQQGKVLRAPPGDAKGQGLAIYDFETVGSLKLDNRGVSTSLETIARTITKNTPQISSAQFAELMLKELRAHADNPHNAFLRFWARLIIELGKSSARPVDLRTASPSKVKLSMLQATLLIRRVQGDLYTLKTPPKHTGMIPPPFSQRQSMVSALGNMDDVPRIRLVSNSPINTNNPLCNLTGDQALLLDGLAIELTGWKGLSVKQLGPELEEISEGIAKVNAVLAWGKLVAALYMMRGEITVDHPPLIRTINSIPGEKRLMTARLWSEVGQKEVLNCVRPFINAFTGLDFKLPIDGPLADVAVEWHFAGDDDTRVNNAGTRNLKPFVLFESPQGADRNREKQVTDDQGVSKMWLVGAAKIPAVAYLKHPNEVRKTANVVVGVTHKSAKDVLQNFFDIGAAVIGVAAGEGLPALIGAAAELGHHVTYAAAWATIPVIDHDPVLAYRPVSKNDDFVISGVICNLEKPFSFKGAVQTIRARNVLLDVTYKFVPYVGTAGTWTANFSVSAGQVNSIGAGGGTYKIEAADTDKPRLVTVGQGLAKQTITDGRRRETQSASIDSGEVDLVPLETDECKEP